MELNVPAKKLEISVLIVENESLTRTLLSNLLTSAGFRVVGAVSSAKAALPLFRKSAPDVLLLNIDLREGPTGLEVATAARKIAPNVGIAFITSMTDIRTISPDQPAMPEASVYLNSADVSTIEQLVTAIQRAFELAKPGAPMAAKADALKSEPLTDLQFELLRQVALGKSNSAIAALKFTTVKSTENAISRLAKKLKIPSDDANNQRILIAREFYKLNRGDIGENSPN
jgi:DNA-binding NarL/FixJ family response regulator